jgi:hypothetical protein
MKLPQLFANGSPAIITQMVRKFDVYSVINEAVNAFIEERIMERTDSKERAELIDENQRLRRKVTAMEAVMKR